MGLASSCLTSKAFSFAQIQVPQIIEKSLVMENTVSKALKSFFVWGEKQNTNQGFLLHCNIVCFVMRFKFLQNALNKKEEGSNIFIWEFLKKKKKVKPQNTIKPLKSEDMHIYSCWRKLIDYKTNFYPWLFLYHLQIFFSWNLWTRCY